MKRMIMPLAAALALAVLPAAAQVGAYSDPAASGGFEASQQAFNAWSGLSNTFAVAYGTAAFKCAGGTGACMGNPWYFTTWFPASQQNLVWSVPLSACDDDTHIAAGWQCQPGHVVSLRAVAQGAEDAAFEQMFSTIRPVWPNAIIRPGWEMNLSGADWTWGVGGTGGGQAEGSAYRAAFRHVAALAHSYGFRVDWCPSLGLNLAPAENFYPGNAYVDIIGEDFYQVANQPFSYWYSEDHGLYWHQQFAKARGKPISYPEWGCGGAWGGDLTCANIIWSMEWWFSPAQNNVAYFNFWNSDEFGGSVKICGSSGSAGKCGPPYKAPQSSAAFLGLFK